jgi:ERCC4-related helicase
VTASPSATISKPNEMENEIARFCSLIDGSIYMPIIHQNELDQTINRPEIKFIEANHHPNEEILISELNKLLAYFLPKLNTTGTIGKSANIKDHNLKAFISNILREKNINDNHIRFTTAKFVLDLFNSIEIMKILGLTQANEFLRELISKCSIN